MTDKLMKLTLLIGGIFFLIGIYTLPHYGINWDTINHLTRGQAYLHYFLTGSRDYKDLSESKNYWQQPDSLLIQANISRDEAIKRSYYQIDGMNFAWFMQNDGKGHPPLSDILSSFFNYIFFNRLGLINDIDAYRIYAIFLAAALVSLIFFWTSKVYGKFAGLIAALSLSLYPLFWSEAHFNNEKDIPETVYWGFFIFCIWKGVISNSWKWILVSGFLFGLALGTKLNIIFIPAVILPWLAILLIPKYRQNRLSIKMIVMKNWKILLSGLMIPITGFTLFFISWPYLWADPVNHIAGVLTFYRKIGITNNINTDFLGPFGINTYPTQWIIYTTPVVILFFSVIGIISIFPRIKKEKDKISILFLLWLIVPILRVTLPKATIYGGIRQIMEYIPALAIFAGLGGLIVRNWLAHRLPKSIFPRTVASVFVVIAFLPIFIKLIQIHPNENVYFNFLIGGLSGAKVKQIPSWGHSFGAAYRQAIIWLNKNAEYNSKMVLTYELMPNIPRLWLRPDLNFSNTYRSGYLRHGEYAIGLVYEGVEERSYYETYLEEFLRPVYEIKVDGTAILKIWKNDEAFLKKPWQEEVIKPVIFSKEDNKLKFDLGKLVNLSRLEIEYDEDNCTNIISLNIKFSPDGKNWGTLPGRLPRAWRIAVLGQQPADGKFLEPFVGQEARFIEITIDPKDSCLKNVLEYKIFNFE